MFSTFIAAQQQADAVLQRKCCIALIPCAFTLQPHLQQGRAGWGRAERSRAEWGGAGTDSARQGKAGHSMVTPQRLGV